MPSRVRQSEGNMSNVTNEYQLISLSRSHFLAFLLSLLHPESCWQFMPIRGGQAAWVISSPGGQGQSAINKLT